MMIILWGNHRSGYVQQQRKGGPGALTFGPMDTAKRFDYGSDRARRVIDSFCKKHDLLIVVCEN